MFGNIQNAQGEQLDYTYCPGASDCSAIVVIGHGVTGNKDRPWAVALCGALGAAGIPAMRISFSGNGDSDGSFEDSTISKEVEDLSAVMDAVGDRRVIYAGHSMGGAVGVLSAARDPRIHALVSLAGMVHTRDFAARKFGDLKPDEDVMWEKPECPLSRTFMEDMFAIDTVVALGARITVPWLLVHGTADSVVPMGDAIDIREAAGGRPDYVELRGADHVFSDDAEAKMTAAVVPWVASVAGWR
jgi:hypothetical protein